MVGKSLLPGPRTVEGLTAITICLRRDNEGSLFEKKKGNAHKGKVLSL